MTGWNGQWVKGCAFAMLTLVGMTGTTHADASNLGHATLEDLRDALLQSRAGAVFTSSNDASANMLMAYDRAWDGSLKASGMYATGGLGTGSGLGSQGAIALSGQWLFVVNAGSNDISTFSLHNGKPQLTGRYGSGGQRPISLTVHGRLLYVLNAGSSSITGFFIGGGGALSPIADSTQPLSAAGVAPAQVGFSPDGDTLIVTEKDTGLIDAYRVDVWGRAHAPQVNESAGQTPFGFAFTPRGELIVSEAFGGAPNGSAVSAYDVEHAVNLDPVSPSVPTHQTAACWVVIGRAGRFAFASNAGSGTISAYRIGAHGMITLVGDGASGVTGAGSKPTDMATSRDARYLYALTAGVNAITAFQMDGAMLDLIGTAAESANTPAGLVAY